MRTLLFFLILLVGACSSPDDAPDNASSQPDGGAESDASNAQTSDMETSDNASTNANAGTEDMSSGGGDDMSNSTEEDMSTLPTECLNDCLCESSCSHRCNIQCKAECASGTCDFELNAGGEITCRAGSTCTISCESGGCEVTCEAGASCELTCGPQAVFCDFVECGGAREECSNRIKTCDSPC